MSKFSIKQLKNYKKHGFENRVTPIRPLTKK